MARAIAYARVSTGEQTTALQGDALRAVEACQVITETASGAATRPKLVRLLRSLAIGDTLVVWRLDRLRALPASYSISQPICADSM